MATTTLGTRFPILNGYEVRTRVYTYGSLVLMVGLATILGLWYAKLRI